MSKHKSQDLVREIIALHVTPAIGVSVTFIFHFVNVNFTQFGILFRELMHLLYTCCILGITSY